MTLSRRCRISSRRYELLATRRRRRSASIRSSERSARSSQRTKASPVRLSDQHSRAIPSPRPPTPSRFEVPRRGADRHMRWGPAQSMTRRSMSGSCCTSTCWATRWSLATSRPPTSLLRRSASLCASGSMHALQGVLPLHCRAPPASDVLEMYFCLTLLLQQGPCLRRRRRCVKPQRLT